MSIFHVEDRVFGQPKAHFNFVIIKSADDMPKTLKKPHSIYFLDVQKEDRNTTGVTKNQHYGDTVLQKDSLNN